MTQTRKQQSIFPDLPRTKRLVENDGTINNEWALYFQQLTMALQTNFKPEGIVVPPKSASDIAELGNVSAAIGNIIYDSTNNEFKGIVAVTLNPVTTVTKTFTLV